MSSKGSGPNSIVSLPKGGGALQGMGEKFSPDLQTGIGNFSVPLALPPGRNGFQPQLSLAYSTGTGNGPFGLGWALSVPGVTRKTSKGVPQYRDDADAAADVFVLSGAEDLVLVETTGAVTRYQPRTEGLFARIEHHREGLNDYWVVKSKDGLVSLYGTPRPKAAGTDWRDPAAIADQERPRHVVAWKLTLTTDPLGNRIEYAYTRDALQSAGAQRWDQLYLKEIRYADYGPSDAATFLVSVRFNYNDRPDAFSDYRSGFEVRTAQRCKSVEIFTRAAQEVLARRYELTYLDEIAPPKALPPNRLSLLASIQVVGVDGAATERLPPLGFAYTEFEPAKRRFIPVAGADLPAVSLADPDFELVDLFGHGLPDIVQLGSAARCWRNLGDGRFDRPREMRDAPAGLRLADPGVQLIDANGDGRIDLLVTTPAMSGHFSTRFNGTWDRRSFHRYKTAPSFNLEDPEVKLVDLTGDGVTDAIRSGTSLDCFFNDPYQGWTSTRRVERRRSLDEFPDVNFSDPRVKWGDLSGDGLQDIALVFDGNVSYWPNLGYGNWGKRVHMRNSPRFPDGYNPKRILVGDVDGDGLADLVYVDNGKVTLWINQSGNAWSDPITITGTPSVSDIDSVRLVDLLGSGVAGLLWSANASGTSRTSMYFLDFTGGLKPYLLNQTDNHIGAVIRVAYKPSTAFYLEAERNRETRWKTPLPFPVQVVAQVEVIDELSKGKLTTEYRYRHGYWDGAEREFRGFALVEHFDTEPFAVYNASGLHGPDTQFVPVDQARQFSPATCTRTWFHVGPVGDEWGEWSALDCRAEFWSGDAPLLDDIGKLEAFLRTLPERRMRRDALRALRGSILRSELYALDASGLADRPYTVTESAYGLRSESLAGSDRPPIFFPHAVAQRTTQWERGDDPLTQFSFSDDYDAFGQPRRQSQVACPRGWRALSDLPGVPYLATHSRTSYAVPLDPTTYIVNRVARSSAYELQNTGQETLLALNALASTGTALKLVGQSYSYYDGPAFEGLAFGQVGAYGVAVRSESLALTEDILQEAYKSGSALQSPPEVPPYLALTATPAWTPDYPAEFRALQANLAGYRFHQGGPDPENARGFFVEGSRRSFDFQASGANGVGRGLPLVTRDALGRDTQIDYDTFALLPVRVTDPAQLTTSVDYDYRVLQAKQATDPNGNQSLFSFSPLGLLTQSFVRGKPGEGDQALPSVTLTYDFSAFAESKRLDPENPRPIFVHSVRRVHHDSESDVALPERDEVIESREYSDGFGRSLQTRAQAEDTTFGDLNFGGGVLPADQSDRAGTLQDVAGRQREAAAPSNVVVSGWQIYDNKGRVVEKYEPFFSTGYTYSRPSDVQFGQKVEMFYDPRGHAVRTLSPDGSEQRVIFGVPGSIATPNLDDPENFAPTPWEAYTYDANDNAGRTHAAESAGYRHHWNTPASIVIDALGRTTMAVERNREPSMGGPQPPIQELRTTSTFDIRGNLVTVTDALGRVAFRYTYDLANRRLRTESIDAGTRRTIPDALGAGIEQRDSKGSLELHAYDVANRPIRLWARDHADEAVTLRECLVYGDGADAGLTRAQAQAANLLGKLYQHYDEAGRLTLESCDFKGNAAEKVRHVIADAAILNGFNPPPANWQVAAFRVDWQPAPGGDLAARAALLLETPEFRTSGSYDAFNRLKSLRLPQDVTAARKQLRPHYNRAGALEQVSLDDATYVERITYDAKGQRALIAYGNGVITRYAHDPKTFRLLRLRSERARQPAPATYRPGDNALQDFAYTYDLAGNITQIRDRTPGSGVRSAPQGDDALDRDFDYDAIYRLLSATGREADRPPDSNPWDDTPRTTDVTKTHAYLEAYTYDAAGNLRRLQHRANGASFTRNLTLSPNNDAPENNRLRSLSVDVDTTYEYLYDENGNMLAEGTSRHFEWDYADRMRLYQTRAGTAEPSIHAQYLYDAGGQRVKKLVRRQGGQVDTTIYVDGVFELQRIVRGGEQLENNTLHVMDNQSRVAVLRVGNAFPDDATPAVKYQLGDHLGSSNTVLGGSGADGDVFINREEYTPYGETSFGSFGRKRYRFTGKERDEESGLNYHGARYYAAWMGRWVSCDPMGTVDRLNLCLYARNRPILNVDVTGTIADAAPEIEVASAPPPSNTEIPSADGSARDFSLETDSTQIAGGDADASAGPSASGDKDAPPPAPEVPSTEVEVQHAPFGTKTHGVAVTSNKAELTIPALRPLSVSAEVGRTEETDPARTNTELHPLVKLDAFLKLKFEGPPGNKLSLGAGLESVRPAGPGGCLPESQAFAKRCEPTEQKITIFGRGLIELEHEEPVLPPNLKVGVKAGATIGGGDNLVETSVELKVQYERKNIIDKIDFSLGPFTEGQYGLPIGRDAASLQIIGGMSWTLQWR